MATPMQTILLVEGNRAGDNSLQSVLEKQGYEVFVVHTGKTTLSWVAEQIPDLVVFDAASMRSSGVRNCRRLRQKVAKTPIIHTRPAGQPHDPTASADIYLEHPFTSRKLLNRVHALLPADNTKEAIVRIGDLTLYLGKRSVEVAGKSERHLTPRLMNLLVEFVRHPNQTVSRRQIMQKVWKTDYLGDTRTLDVHIRWIREAIEANPSKPQRLLTVRGVGYVFCLPAGERPSQPTTP